MTEDASYRPSPSDRVRNQVDLYESTDGAEGGTLEDRPVIILTHTGVKSGATRKTPLMRVEYDGRYAIIASNAASPVNPAWYANVVANPVVAVQDRSHKWTMRAREVFGEEKTLWWQRADRAYPSFADYRVDAGRDIPIFVLEPTGSLPLPSSGSVS